MVFLSEVNSPVFNRQFMMKCHVIISSLAWMSHLTLDIFSTIRDWFGHFCNLIVFVWLERPGFVGLTSDLWLSMKETGTWDIHAGMIWGHCNTLTLFIFTFWRNRRGLCISDFLIYLPNLNIIKETTSEECHFKNVLWVWVNRVWY